MCMLKRILSFILVFSIVLGLLPTVFAEDLNQIDKDSLRVSDEFAEIYPNGYLEFATTAFETSEGEDEFNVIVARRGGTDGEITVDFKVLETSAKYGEDFTVLVSDFWGEKEIKKDKDSPTIMESNVDEQEEQVIKSNRILQEELESETEGEKENEIGTETETEMESETESEIGTETEKHFDDGVLNEDNTNEIEENGTEWQELEFTPDSNSKKDEMSDKQYKSELHRMRDEALGTESTYTTNENYTSSLFGITDPKSIETGEAFNAVMPGARSTLTFEDGENYKVFKVRIIDDTIYETPEQFVLGLYEPTNGAVLGDRFNSYVTINDNDDTEDYIIQLENSEYEASCGDESVRVKITKTGALSAFTDAEISTRGGSALPDKHYIPVVNTALFLPGETEKIIEIPLINSGINEQVSFEVVLSNNSKNMTGNSIATVLINPVKSIMQSVTDENTITRMSNYTEKIMVYPDSFKKVKGNTYMNNGYWNLITKGKPTEECKIEGKFDLRGIEKVGAHWQFKGKNNNNAKAIVWVNDKKDTWTAKFDWKDGILMDSGFSRQNNATISFEANRRWGVECNVYVYNVTLYKQKFHVEVLQADPITQYSFTSPNNKTSISTFSPGGVNLSKVDLYRDEKTTITPYINSDHKDKGLYLKGFYICDKEGRTMSSLITGNQIEMTPSFIEYVYYIARSQTEKILRIKPVFDRYNASDVQIIDYDKTAGELKFGNDTYFSDKKIRANGMKVGDKIVVTCSPNTGFDYNGVTLYTTNDIGSEINKYAPAQAAKVGKDTKINVNLVPSDKKIRIMWRAPMSGNTETEEVNRARGKIYHDQWEKMPEEEKSILFKGVNYQKIITPPDSPAAEMTSAQKKEYDKKYETYLQAINERSNKINANYAEYMKKFSTYSIDKASLGDMITLYANPMDGYTVRWYSNVYAESGKIIPDSELMKVQPHFGNSYTFIVTDDLQYIYYYYEKNNTAGNKIFTGKVITGHNTIKHQKAFDVDVNNPNTYRSVKGVQISVATGSDANATTTVDGKTYTTNAITDENGSFKVYVPNAVGDAPFSIKLMDGSVMYAKSGMINNQVAYVLPFMDEFRVTSLDVQGLYSNDTTLKPIDEEKEIYINTNSTSGRAIQRVVLRSYDNSGALWTTLEAYSRYNNQWVIKTNLMESFKNNGRFTIEIYDDKNIGHGEIEAGYTILEDPAPGDINFPTQDSIGDGLDLSFVGNASPSVDLGSAREKVPELDNPETKTYTIAIKTGKILKQAIADNVNDMDSKTAQEKLNILTTYLVGNYTNLKDKTWKEKPSVPKPGSVKEPPEGEEGRNGKTNTGKGKTALSIDFDFGYYMQMTREEGKNGGKDIFYFDYSIIFLAGSIDFKADLNLNIAGFPVYVSFMAGGEIKGLFLADGRDKLEVGGEDGWMPKWGTKGADWVSVLQGNIYIGLGAGIGQRGVLSIGISGKLVFGFQYQYANDGTKERGSEGSGTVAFGLSVDIDILFIPIKINIKEWTWKLFQTDGFVPNAWMPISFRAIDASLQDAEVSVDQSSRSDVIPDWKGREMYHSVNPSTLVSTRVLLRDGMNNQSPFIIGYTSKENIQKELLLFLNDDKSRNEYNYASLNYSLSTLNDEESVWTDPVPIQDDNTFDSDHYAVDLGDTIAVVWVSGTTSFEQMPEPDEAMNNTDVFISIFDKQTETFSAPEKVTDDAFANSKPNIMCDKDGNLMVVYITTDYATDGAELSLDDLTVDNVGNFVNNSYSTLCHSKYENGSWISGFLPIDIDELETPFVTELASASYVKENLGIIVYCLDEDNDSSTIEDQEICMIKYDYNSKSYSEPVVLTENNYQDSNPHLVQKDDEIKLFWNSDGYISYCDLESVLENGIDSMYHTRIDWNQNAEMATSFYPTIGQDGNAYIVWTQNDILTEKIDPNKDDDTPENIKMISERQIYFGMYDKNYEVYEDEGTIEYRGRWGKPFMITSYNGEINDSPVISVDAGSNVTVASAVSRAVSETEDGKDQIAKSETSDLIVRKYSNATSLEILSISTYPEYPTADMSCRVDIKLKNYGSIASDGITTIANVFRNDVLVPEESITFEPVSDHFASDETKVLSYYMNFTDPQNTKVVFDIYEDEYKYSAKEATYELNFGPSVIIQDIYASFIGNNKVVVNSFLENVGNDVASGYKVVLDADSETDDLGNTTREKFAEIDLPTILKDDLYPLEFIADIPKTAIEDGTAEMWMNIIDNNGETVYSDCVYANVVDRGDTEIEGLLFNDTDSENASLNISVGEMADFNSLLYPIEAADYYTLMQHSNNTDIFDIDPETGYIVAKKTGTADLVIEAHEISNLCLQREDGTFIAPNGNVIRFNDDGTLAEKLEPSVGNIIKTYNIPITVKKASVSIGGGGGGGSSITHKATYTAGEGGKIEGNAIQTVAHDKYTEEVRAVADEGYKFIGWSDDIKTETRSDKLIEDISVTAYFEKDTTWTNPFIDVANSDWFYEYVEFVNKKGLMNGVSYNEFSPNTNITRGMFATVIHRIEETQTLPTIPTISISKFTDVDSNEYYANAVNWAYENEIVKGVSDFEFAPNDFITREEMVTMIFRYSKFKGKVLDGGYNVIPDYIDVNDTSEYAVEALMYCTMNGIVQGDENRMFMPKSNTIRSEAAAVFKRIFENLF